MRLVDVRHDVGVEFRFDVYNEPDMAIVKDMGGRWRFEHQCFRVGADVALTNPSMDVDGKSIGNVSLSLGSRPRASLYHSVHCSTCEALGFIRDSLWSSLY